MSPGPVRLELADVSVCVADCAMPDLAARALSHCTRLCGFAQATLFTDADIVSRDFRTRRIPALDSRQAYSHFILKELNGYVHTPYCLVIQWDGYVLDPRCWQDSFRGFDYIGARWPWITGMNVGNGGFSFRSKRLLMATASADFTLIEGFPEDELICRVHRPRLESALGIRFADENAANGFSYERSLPELPTFGFHGLFNMWRHVPDQEMIGMSGSFTPNLCRSREFFELLADYVIQRRFQVAYAMYRKLRTYFTADEFGNLLREFFAQQEFVLQCQKVFTSLELIYDGSSVAWMTPGNP